MVFRVIPAGTSTFTTQETPEKQNRYRIEPLFFSSTSVSSCIDGVGDPDIVKIPRWKPLFLTVLTMTGSFLKCLGL